MYSTTNVLWTANGGRPLFPGSAAAKADAAESRGLVRKVLVVDDEPDLADTAGMLLNAYGLEVVVAYSAHDALEALQSDAGIDAIFSDIMMPRMTGLQLADVVNEMYPSIKIVLTSGYTRSTLLESSGRPYPFATKPYVMTEILDLLRK